MDPSQTREAGAKEGVGSTSGRGDGVVHVCISLLSRNEQTIQCGVQNGSSCQRVPCFFLLHVVVVVVVVVLTLTRIIKPVVTEQDPVTLIISNTPGKKRNMKPKVVHVHITADAMHAFAIGLTYKK